MPLPVTPAIPVLVTLLEAELPIEAPRRLVLGSDLEVSVARPELVGRSQQGRNHGARMPVAPFFLVRADVEEAGGIVLDDGESRGNDSPAALDHDPAQRQRHPFES